jgi:hypothetical protein
MTIFLLIIFLTLFFNLKISTIGQNDMNNATPNFDIFKLKNKGPEGFTETCFNVLNSYEDTFYVMLRRLVCLVRILCLWKNMDPK